MYILWTKLDWLIPVTESAWIIRYKCLAYLKQLRIPKSFSQASDSHDISHTHKPVVVALRYCTPGWSPPQTMEVSEVEL